MIAWSASTGHFYHVAVHGDAVPADAVKVTPRRHAELLAGQGRGCAIEVGAGGKPILSTPRKVTVAQLRAFAVVDIKAEAKRRILAVASLDRQANDNATFALFALNMADSADFDAAWGRRSAIDAIRASSNALEATIADWSAAALANFDAGADALWLAGV